MPRHKAPASLLSCSLLGLERLTAAGALGCCEAVVRTHRGHLEDTSTGFETKEMVEALVAGVRDWLWGHVVPATRDLAAAAILRGLEAAAERKKTTSTTNREMAILVTFVDLVVTERMVSLDLTDISKILRSNMFDKLPRFVGLRSLALGSGTGGWSNMYVEKFASGVRAMKHLVKFSLCYDCTDSIVKLLVRNCKATLRILDVEMSKQVTDDSAGWMCQAKQLHTLQIFHTGMTEEGHATLLTKLPNLKVLVRGGFLCEALEAISLAVPRSAWPRLQLEEFWSSEDYFFHDAAQMALVREMCPRMRKIMFQFSKEVMTDVLFLTSFDNLNELHLWGGEFYSDKINQVLAELGPQLHTLYLIHAEEVDQAAVRSLARSCPNLATLGLYLCDFVDTSSSTAETAADPEQEFYHRRREREEMELLLELETLAVISDCAPAHLLLLLSAALNLRTLKTGQNCPLTDADIVKVLETNQLQQLQHLSIPASQHLTMATVELLLANCDQLRSIQDLNYWSACSPHEVEALRSASARSNLDIDLGRKEEERKVQKHLDDLNEDVVNYLRGITDAE